MNLRDRPFRLSKAEARVAALVLQGLKPQMIARRLGKELPTIRTQLRAIFQKSGTVGQADFVHKVAVADGWDCSPYV